MGTIGHRRVGKGGGPTRREVLRAGVAGSLGLGCGLEASGSSAGGSAGGAVILIMMVGGPGQLDSFDPKPDAPAEVRGPFGSIATALPGVRVSEHLPRVARRLDRLTLIRSLRHDHAPTHEVGLQLLGTGGLGPRPHVGALAACRLGSEGGVPPFVILPRALGPTGANMDRGQSPGPLGPDFGPFVLGDDPASPRFDPRSAWDRARRFVGEAPGLRASGGPGPGSGQPFELGAERPSALEAYGRSTFGRSCLMARRLVEAGARMVVIHMAETVFDRPSWDNHGRGPFSTFADQAENLLPDFDRGFSALVDDLGARGRLGSTLVVASGEFGRTPRINESGGRDHWPGAWSAVVAGGGMAGGRVIGATDAHASAPVDRPCDPAELAAMMARALGLSPGAIPGPVA